MTEEEMDLKEISEIKALWIEINDRLSRLEKSTVEESRRVTQQKIRSAQEDLIRKYARFSRLSFIMAIVFPLFYGNPANTIFDYPTKLYSYCVGGAMCAFFLICGVMDLYLSNAVKDINLATMSVIEVRRQAINLKRCHHIFQMILIPLAIGVLILMLYPIIEETWIGAIIGLVIGLSIGISVYIKMMADYKEIINS